MRGAGSLCTGTLVHPEIILYASHCEAPTAARFGESSDAPARTVPIDHCTRFGDGQVGPDDYAYCRLAEPVDDVPLTPVAYGCEVELAAPEAPAHIAGFGVTDGGEAGTKHWAQTEVVAITQMVLVGKDGTSAWSGDSGGGAFVRVPLDGSWRLFGIASGGTVAGMPIQYVQAFTVVPWVESESGVDITPCHDPDGTWSPTEACAGFALDPLAAGDWTAGCDAADPGSGPSGTCGAPFGDDAGAPAVEIVAPSDGDMLPEGEPVEVQVEASDAETGIRWVRLHVDDPMEEQALAEDGVAPYLFEEVELDPGAHVLVAVAEDLAGNVTASAPVEVVVGDPDGGTGDGTEAGAGPVEEGGCACTVRTLAPRTPRGGLCAFALLILLRHRRSSASVG
jgi:hypothetical protein